MSPGEAEVRLEHICLSYAAPNGAAPLRVLEDLTLGVAASELVCIAGRSGSGKTSLLNVAACLIPPSSGHVYWGAREVAGLDPGSLAKLRRERLGYVFQNAGLIAMLTAEENVALPGMPLGRRGDARERVDALLALVGLNGRARHYPAQLSGGEQQRVGLARALYADPPLLVIDEPTANLDRSNADEIIRLLIELRDRGKAILAASHDPSLISQADQIVQMEQI